MIVVQPPAIAERVPDGGGGEDQRAGLTATDKRRWWQRTGLKRVGRRPLAKHGGLLEVDMAVDATGLSWVPSVSDGGGGAG